MNDDEDPACIDCALGHCRQCLLDDPQPPGKRECCCGIESEIPTWGDQ